jgi:acetyltransferase-like isoleucine patch superfamily enzyme
MHPVTTSADTTVHPLRTLWSRLRLWRCSEVGRAPSVVGRVWVHGGGSVRVGHRVRIEAGQAAVELHAGPGAELVIGDDVVIGAGSSIEALRSVTIGDRSCLGGFTRIMDNHFHAVQGDRQERPSSVPVVIGADASIGWRAILLPGARVAPGAAVPAGGIVRAGPVALSATSLAPAESGRTG